MATAPVRVPDPQQPPHRSAIRLAGRTRYPVVYFDRRIDNSHLALEPDPAEGVRCARLAGVCICAFLVVFGIVLLHVKSQRYGYEISRLKSESAQLNEANQKLRLEKAALTNPQRIDQLARADLGLQPSQPQQIIRMGRPEPAAAANAAPVVARNFSAAALPRGRASAQP